MMETLKAGLLTKDEVKWIKELDDALGKKPKSLILSIEPGYFDSDEPLLGEIVIHKRGKLGTVDRLVGEVEVFGVSG